jgi:acyl-homoserine lactone synthase
MFEVHVIDAKNRESYRDILEAYFRLRYEIYVGERGWHDLARSDGREVDAFDTNSAVYLLGITPDRRVVGGSRLIPTLRPHLMSEVFPFLAPDGIRRGKDIFEWTRIFVVPELRTPGRPCQAAGVMYCGMLEYCLQAGIRQLSVVCEEYWVDRLSMLGWKPERLGEGRDRQGNLIVGLLLHMTREALATTRKIYGVKDHALRFAGSPAAQHSKQGAPIIRAGRL